MAELIRDKIMSGSIGRGEPLREEAVASDYAVSRRTARDALRVLGDDGLVRHQRHKGSNVIDFGVEDIVDVYESRRLLEVGAAQWWCKQPPGTGTSRLASLAESYDWMVVTMSSADDRRIVEADVGFHARVIGLLGSPRVDAFFASIATQMVYALALLEMSGKDSRTYPDTTLAEHRAIYDALEARSHEAVELIEEHVQCHKHRLVSLVTQIS
ncbi:GntR family transcriptional regulator [Rhodococcus sp. NPDC060176]|uniref:GntR family transcriptional regulator n=1 Tax=Rhodococcus sp. NPDC060176 TaxID=3347062 RepID=UPI003669C495